MTYKQLAIIYGTVCAIIEIYNIGYREEEIIASKLKD